MRELLVINLIVCSLLSSPANAQGANNLMLDLNYCHGPGVAMVYNYKVVDSIGIGIGGQTLHDNRYKVQKTALFVDVRYQFIIGRSLLFIHGDIGVDIHKSYTTSFGATPSPTLYAGLGLGYGYIVNEWSGTGPYLELRFWGDGYMGSQVDDPDQSPHRFYNMDMAPVIALGYKFW